MRPVRKPWPPLDRAIAATTASHGPTAGNGRLPARAPLPAVCERSEAPSEGRTNATAAVRFGSTAAPDPSVAQAPEGAAPWPLFMAGQLEKPVRVIVVDDDAHIRRVIAQELMADRRTVLVAEASSLREGKRVVRDHDFDVLLVDLNLGDGRGYDLIAYAKEFRSSVEAVVVSVLEADDDVMHAFELGASGFLVKNSWFGGFAQAVLQVANGGASITPSLARRMLLRFDRGGLRNFSPVARTRGKLSEREREVLRMISGGMTSVEIGATLGISHLTVNTHVKNIYSKLQVRNRAQAVRFATASGIL
jgi:DNA-binding NarL/FixJ family response regulator